MNSNLKPAALSAFAILSLSLDLEANASAVLNGPAEVSRSASTSPAPQDEQADPPCSLAPPMTLTGAGGRSRAGSREERPRSAPARAEPPVFVKNPFLSTAP
jgi:hypothetical protein